MCGSVFSISLSAGVVGGPGRRREREGRLGWTILIPSLVLSSSLTPPPCHTHCLTGVQSRPATAVPVSPPPQPHYHTLTPSHRHLVPTVLPPSLPLSLPPLTTHSSPPHSHTLTDLPLLTELTPHRAYTHPLPSQAPPIAKNLTGNPQIFLPKPVKILPGPNKFFYLQVFRF